ncbi:MAG TPA: thioredoxin family protein [Sphingomicrobium sp.]|nr:thioredoxin family protein [Sphingomicrobium sp.]
MIRRVLHILLAIALCGGVFGVAGPTVAQLPTAASQRHMAIQLVAESDRPRSGSVIDLAFQMTPHPGWHGYWKNPGDSGLEPTIDWQLPPGVTISELEYPVPERLIIGGLMNYVYEGPYALLAKVRVAPDLSPGTRLPLRGKFDYLVCTKEICVPESANVALDLVVGDGAISADRRSTFDAYRRALPQPLNLAAKFQAHGDTFRLAVPLPAEAMAGDAYFYPLTDGAIDYAAEQKIGRNGDWLIIEAKRGAGEPDSVSGVLELGERGLSLVASPGSVPAATEALSAAQSGDSVATTLGILLAALVGGLLLNIMPCVFPILSLKALSLAKGGGVEQEVRRDALAYTSGAVVTCVALGVLVLALRAGGSAAGWAFQLQDPRVILVLLLLILAIALNFAGLFELPSLAWGDKLSRKPGTAGAFWTGGLAAFVATPCTGPFMATALGAALILPPPVAIAVFAMLGLGLALPFLLIGFVPALRRRLPRPGPWMNTFRRILSIPMFLTALALAWVLGRQSGVTGMTIGLAASLAAGLSLWWLGTSGGRSAPWVRLAPAMVALVVGLSILPSGGAVAGTPASSLAGESFSEERLSAHLAQGKPVFAYFTADWCITCKVNEKTVLERPAVAEAFARNNVAVLVGDWTNGDPAIGRFLEKHGRSGVPLYLYYPPTGRPQILPQLLTISQVVSTVEQGS